MAWDWWPTNLTAAVTTNKSFDFRTNKVGNLSFDVFESFQGGADYGNTELEANDMAGREAYINYQDRRSDLDQLQIIGSWDNNDGLFMESLVSVDFGLSTQETTFVSQKWFNWLKTGYVNDGDPANLTFMFLPDDVLEKQYFPGIMGSEGDDFYYFYMPKADMNYWFGRATYQGTGTTVGAWWNANGPLQWPEECQRNDAFDADGNPNGARVVSGYTDPSNAGTETPSTVWGQLEGCYGDRDNFSVIKESLDSLFVNLNFETVTDKGQELRAQFGLRYEDTERTSISDTQVPLNTAWSLGVFEYGNRYGFKTGPATFTAYGSGDYLLPSLNVSFEHAENRVIRFAANKTIARPSLEQLDSANDIGAFSTFSPTVIGTGNPNLEPYESVNYDFAYEYYYKEGSYVAVNLFVKEISGYHGSGMNQSSYNGVTDISAGPRVVYDGTYNDEFCAWTGGFGTPEQGAIDQGWWACGWTQAVDWQYMLTTMPWGPDYDYSCKTDVDCINDPGNGNAVYYSNAGDPLYIFNLAQPVNKYDGTLEGAELAIQHLFDNGFGIVANVTHIAGDTDVDPYELEEQFALPGFGDAANFAAFYEDDKVSARVAYNLTGEYYTGNDEYNPLFVTERGTVDFNATYFVNDNVAVFVEGINVTDEDVHLYSRYEDMLFLYQDHGPIYKAGFRVNF